MNFCILFIRILIVLTTMFAFGCAPTLNDFNSEALLPEIDVVQVKEYSEEALKLAQEAKIDVQMINTKLSEIDNRLIVLSEEVSTVSLAKIEELENRIALLIEAFKDLHEQMAAIEILPQIRITKLKNSKPALFSPSNSAQIITSSEYDYYQKALRTFDRKNYTKSRELFENIIKKFPNGDYNDKAQFWVGECYYADAEYAKGINAFGKVLDYKKSSKCDDSQLKIGLSYLRMGENDLAIGELKRLVNRYPTSEYVSRAQKYLKEISLQ